MDNIINPVEICVIGRTSFSSGIGSVTYAACELLSRSFPVCIYPTDSMSAGDNYITLPNGRQISRCIDLLTQKVFFFTDVLWNGAYDYNYTFIPKHGLKIAHIAYDSDELPEKWVDILNQHFTVAYFSSAYLERVAMRSGVTIPVGVLPIGLDIEKLLTIPKKEVTHNIQFLSIAAFHRRKGADILVEAFLEEFCQDENVELVIHSNITSDTTYKKLVDMISAHKATNIRLSSRNLDAVEKDNLLSSCDIFVNCSRGEGYSIGPREAMALGKVLVLSDIDAHQDLSGVSGVFMIPISGKCPARYPEIDNLVFGKQRTVAIADVRQKLREAYDFTKKSNSESSFHERRRRAREFSFTYLTRNYAETISPDITKFKVCAKTSRYTYIPANCRQASAKELGHFNHRLEVKNRKVVPAHDGGFFSVFNVFMSHLAWDLNNDKCHMVLPDWDVNRLLIRHSERKLMSFCYGTREDGNIWLKLFKPLYGLTEKEMNDENFLYDKSRTPEDPFNENREPHLTYTRAYGLYKSPSFKLFRRQYHRVFSEHIKLLPAFQDEVNIFCEQHFADKFMLAAHVKHPSHIIEQPNMQIAHGQAFIEAIKRRLAENHISFCSDSWGVFLATDQERVVAQFKDAFGDRVYYFTEVRRTKLDEDIIYDNLPEAEKAKEGFQVQHLVAASPENWSTRMAWEVLRDAIVMSKCHVLFHIVSNVSTAVSYFNPEIEMFFVD